jgi:hypothetical protein
MRQGHITRPPRREIVMAIADYFNCTLLERNRLLLAAHTFPVEVFLTGPELEQALAVAKDIARTLPMPAMVINRDWRIHYFNDGLLRLYDVSAQQIADLPSSLVNLLQLLFDPALPLYPNVIRHRASWEQMAIQTICAFKLANQLSIYEPWYQQTVSQFMRLPGFAEYWRQAQLDQHVTAAPTVPLGVILETTVPRLDNPARTLSVRPLAVSVGYFHYTFPQIIGLLPVAAADRAIFEEIELPYILPAPEGQVVP